MKDKYFLQFKVKEVKYDPTFNAYVSLVEACIIDPQEKKVARQSKKWILTGTDNGGKLCIALESEMEYRKCKGNATNRLCDFLADVSLGGPLYFEMQGRPKFINNVGQEISLLEGKVYTMALENDGNGCLTILSKGVPVVTGATISNLSPLGPNGEGISIR